MKFNRCQTSIEDLHLEDKPQEVVEKFYEYINNVPFIRNLISEHRPECSDLPRDKDGKAIIDLCNPPLLKDMEYFVKARDTFIKEGSYCPFKPSKNKDSSFWKWYSIEYNRIRDCRVRPSDGMWIPGTMYWYLNYTRLQKTVKIEGKNIGEKLYLPPDIWDGIFLRSHYQQQARYGGLYNDIGGLHSTELAARGKSKSYWAAAQLSRIIVCGNSNTEKKNVRAIVAAYQTEYLTKDGTLNKFVSDLDFITNHTQFPSHKLKDTILKMDWVLGYHDMASDTDKGVLNEVLGVSTNDNMGKLRGKRAALVLLEEAGCHLKGTKVIMYDYSVKKVEDIIIGDIIMGDDGTSRNVLKTFSGKDMMYKITLSNGDFQIVNSIHPVYFFKKCLSDNNLKPCTLIAPELMQLGSFNKDYYIRKASIKIPGREALTSESNNYTFTVTPYGIGDYYGFTIDKNHLFLLDDLTIVHNTFPQLKSMYRSLLKSVQDGDIATGLLSMFGTAGDKKSDFTAMKEIMYHPVANNMYALPNVFDANSKGMFTFFFGSYLNRPSFYDKDGNSDVTAAIISILMERYKIKNNTDDPDMIIRAIAEDPIVPKEAVIQTNYAFFPKQSLSNRLDELLNTPQLLNSIVTGTLEMTSTGEIKYKQCAEEPIRVYPLEGNKFIGACEFIQMPEYNKNNKVFSNRYIAGIDPYDQDVSSTQSLGSLFILDLWTDKIVLEYTGRPSSSEEFYEICRLALMFYNATANYENNLKGIFGYFSKMNCLHLLSDTLDFLRDKQMIKAGSFGNTSKGTPATNSINNYANLLTRNWLIIPEVMQTRDSEGNPVEVKGTHVNTLMNKALIMELIAYNPEINVDRVRAFGMLMLLREDKIIMYNGDIKEGNTVDKNYLGNDKFFTSNYDNKRKFIKHSFK